MSNIITVTQLNTYASSVMEDDEILQFLMVAGEISNFKRYPSGHCYFSLKDSDSVIRCVMFNSFARNLKIRPESGMNVVAAGSAEIYPKNGEFQLKVQNMLPFGEGEAQVKQDILAEKLRAEGLFDRKRTMPKLPKKIAVVTSPEGAALRDIINVLERRYPIAELQIFPAYVQGDAAPRSIVNAINDIRGFVEENADNSPEVAIIARGGGSKEDLSAFDAEEVARAVFGCVIPTISAVGHETDFTLIDFVSDLRAPTPSAAAELCAPSLTELYERIKRMENAISARSPARQLEVYELKLLRFNERLGTVFASRFARYEECLWEIATRMANAVQNRAAANEAKLREYALRLETLNPLNVLARGYSVVSIANVCVSAQKKGSKIISEKIITSANELKSDDTVKITFNDGHVYAKIFKEGLQLEL